MGVLAPMSPLISIICPCYNHEQYVAKAIMSLLGQSYADFEIIVVDDGSTDGSVGVIRRFDDRRLHLITQENHGPGHASSRAIAAARGAYIALMAADDLSAPQRLAIQLEDMKRRSLDVHFFRPALIDERDRPLLDSAWPVFYRYSFSSQEDLFYKLFYRQNFLCATGAMLRRNIIEKFGWVHNGMLQLQDFDYWVRLAPYCRFGMSEDRQFLYRVRDADGNLSSRKNSWRSAPEKSLIYRRFFDDVPREFLVRAFPDLTAVPAAAPEAVFQAHLSLLYLRHRIPAVQMIGIERLIALMERSADYELLKNAAAIDIQDVYRRLQVVVGNTRQDSDLLYRSVKKQRGLAGRLKALVKRRG